MQVYDIVGLSATTTIMSTTANCTPPLSTQAVERAYAVWAIGQPAYIGVTNSPAASSLITTANSFYIPAAAVEPIAVRVPPGYQITFLSSSSGSFAYQQVNF